MSAGAKLIDLEDELDLPGKPWLGMADADEATLLRDAD
jgi:hypothetical protein